MLTTGALSSSVNGDTVDIRTPDTSVGLLVVQVLSVAQETDSAVGAELQTTAVGYRNLCEDA